MIRNLTPHDLHFFLDPAAYTRDDRGNLIANPGAQPSLTIPRESATGARATMRDRPIGADKHEEIGIPRYTVKYGDVEGLPNPSENVLVVSIVAAQAAKQHGRTTHDLRMPYGIVRDDAGRIVGCIALQVVT